MTRRENIPPTKAKPAKKGKAEPPASIHDRIDGALSAELENLTAIRDTLRLAMAEVGPSPALVRESSALARAIVAVSSELRAREKHDRRLTEKLTVDQMLEFALLWIEHELPAIKRLEIRELLDRLDSEGMLS